MSKLCQIIALVKGKKSEVQRAISDAYKVIQKETLFDGLKRTFKPLAENGFQYPAEEKRIQAFVNELLDHTTSAWRDSWDLVATQDAANQTARADVEVDGKKLLTGVAVTTLLFMEKQLNDVESFISQLPTPDPGEKWEHDASMGCLRAATEQKEKTKKITDFTTVAAATEQHPAQVREISKDVVEGIWQQIKYTTRIPADTKVEYLTRVKKIRDAVKVAREAANMTEAPVTKVADKILEMVFA